MNYIDENEIRKTIAIMKPNNQLFEVRLLEDKKNYSGYFKDAETLIRELKKVNLKNVQVYMTLGHIDEACFSRKQKECFIQYAKNSTSDNDILSYDWLMIDLDPKRSSGTSSSSEEIQKAKELGNKIYNFMQTIGFNKPLTAFSGNGVHLLYRVALKNTDENKELVKKCLLTLDMLFSGDGIDIDTSTFNQSRICKLYGTLSQKGSDTKSRPHRMSKVIGNPIDIKVTDRGYLTKLCDLYPSEPDKPQRYNNYNGKEFNLQDWMDKHGLNYKISSYSDGTKYILDCCPFDSSHNGKDACIFQSRSHGIGFHCFHNSCSDKTWKDVRILFEPDAYEKKQQEYEKRAYGTFNRDKKKESKTIVEEADKPIFLNANDIYNMPKENEAFVKTGIKEIDNRLRGLKKGFTSVWSGLRGSSKSTILSGIMLNAVDQGNNVGCFSGELSPKNFMRWMNLQAAGKGNVEPSKYEGYYNVSRTNQKFIADWLDKHFWLYNNDYGNDSKAILEQFERVIDEMSLDLLVLDNLMAFDITTLNYDKYEAQKDFVWKLHNMAQKYDVHICFVAHPRKAQGFLRLDDISGSADITNAVENAFIVHRVNNDFKRLTKQMFYWSDEEPVYQATNVVEIAKDRDGGTQDVFIPLWYEMETKRLKNYQSENVIYGWDKSDGFTSVDELMIGEQTEIPF